MDRVGCDVVCKSHSARSNRDQYRICPTKLSKQELENLYFAVIENNLELKKTINGQQDRIKVLTTKVQRISSAQKIYRADERKDSCGPTRAVFNQQKEMIADLKNSNERMSERIRKLNMRLCSAKQFCKSATPRCLRCSTATSPYLIKQSASSLKQQSQSTIKLAVSCHNLSRETMVTKCVQTEFFDSARSKGDKKLCEDNKCSTLVDELKQKIIHLQEDISRTRDEYQSRVVSLEQDVQVARSDVVRVRAERLSLEHELQMCGERCADVTGRLRTACTLVSDLKTQLSIEKRKVAELETRLKASTMSNRVTKTIEDTLTSIQESNKAAASEVTSTNVCSPRYHTDLSIQQTYTGLSPQASNNDETKLSKSADDSGYTDTNSQVYLDDQSLNRIIEDLSRRIIVLQTQVDALTISPPTTESAEPKTVENSTLTDDQSIIPTVLKLTHTIPNRKTQTPPKILIQQPKDTTEQTEKDITKSETTISPTRRESLQIYQTIPVSETTKGGLKATLNKVNIISKIGKEMDGNAKDNIDTGNKNTNVTNRRWITSFNKAAVGSKVKEKIKSNAIEKKENVIGMCESQDKEITDTSSEDKTYDISHKSDRLLENETKINKTVAEKDIQNANKNKSPLGGVKNCAKIVKIPLKDAKEYKLGIKEKEDANNEIDGTKRLLDNKGQDQKDRVKGVNMALMLNNIKQNAQIVKRKLLETENVSTDEEATYTVEHSSRSSSPDNTDYEISSMTDLPDEREPKSPRQPRLSPGERGPPPSRSHSLDTHTNYSLSDGEIPTATGRRKSSGDKSVRDQSTRASPPKMEETLQAITDELARCKRLLFSSRP